jgi:hypothetical protein
VHYIGGQLAEQTECGGAGGSLNPSSADFKIGARTQTSAGGQGMSEFVGDIDETVRAALGRFSAFSVFLYKSILYGAFVCVCKALNGPKRRFLARADALL